MCKGIYMYGLQLAESHVFQMRSLVEKPSFLMDARLTLSVTMDSFILDHHKLPTWLFATALERLLLGCLTAEVSAEVSEKRIFN